MLENLQATGAPDLDQRQRVQAYREVLESARTSLAARLRDGVPASALVQQSAEFIDSVLAKAWGSHALNVDRGLALVAVGGYGRG